MFLFTSRVWNSLFSSIRSKIHLLLILLLQLNTSLIAQVLPSSFNSQLFKNGWTEVEGFRFDNTGQTYVYEKRGMVWVVDTNGVKLANPLINISDEVGNWRDHGLNGFALDPNFRTNGYFYLCYTVDRHHLLYYGTPNYNAATNAYYNATIIRVTRYTADPATNFTTTIAGSRLVLLGETKKTGIPLLHESHSGAQLVFGADGSLLVSTGDGASYSLTDAGSASGTYWSQALTDSIIKQKENVGAFRSQLVDCMAGKILRIDPATGDGIPSNPFYNAAEPRSAQSRVWCLGLRNPFRMTLRPGTGNSDINAGNPGVLYIGDVSWNAYEDLHIADTAGLNFGWPLFEGLTPNSSYQGVTAYNRDAPNPLYGTGGCTQQFLQFKHLCIQDTLTATPSWPNPCNSGQQIPSTLFRFKHARPAIDWQHGSAHARTGIWNGTSASQVDLNNPLSPVPGPVFAGNASVGGAWYTGAKYPPSYLNSYFHGDYGQGWIRNFKFTSNNAPDSVKDFASTLGAVVFIEYNPKDQWLYYVKYPSEIYKITYSGALNLPPTAVASCDTICGLKPLTINFTGSNSIDPENQPLTYEWNFGDGSPVSTLANPSHVFNPVDSNPLTYMVKVTVTDDVGFTSTDSILIHVNNTPPQIEITSIADSALYTMSHQSVVPLEASVTDLQSPDSLLTYEWVTFLHHNEHEHPELPDNDRITTTIITPIGCDTNIYYYRIQLTVTDPQGLSTTVDKRIFPECNPPIAEFNSTKTSGCVPHTVTFADSSTNFPDSLQWTFIGGNPSTSVLPNPVVVYDTAGTYEVTLIATSSRGSGSITKTGYITVGTPPTATITPWGIDSMCSAGSIKLSANTGPGLSYQWLKSGKEIAGATDSVYYATKGGTYKVRVTSSGCSKNSYKSEKIVIRAYTASITPQGPTTFCSGDSVVLSANDGTFTYQWKRNGVLLPGETTKNYVAKIQGNYKTIVTDKGGCIRTSANTSVLVPCRNFNTPSNSEFAVHLYPNPTQSSTILSVNMPEQDMLKVKIYNLLGDEVIYELNENISAGYYEITITKEDLNGPGVYFVNVSNTVETKTIKLIVY